MHVCDAVPTVFRRHWFESHAGFPRTSTVTRLMPKAPLWRAWKAALSATSLRPAFLQLLADRLGARAQLRVGRYLVGETHGLRLLRSRHGSSNLQLTY